MNHRDKTSIRIKDLTEKYLKERNLEIEKANKEIDTYNNETSKAHNEANKQLLTAIPFTPEPHIRKYTTKKFTEDISNKYKLRFEYIQYNQYINGTAYPSLELLHALSDTFGVTIDYLSGYSDSPNPALETIATLLPLNDKSLATLVNLSSNTTYRNMLDALLIMPESTASLLQNIRNQLQQRYEQTVRIQKNQPSTKQELLLSTMYYEEYLSQLEHLLLPILRSEFEQKIAAEDEF